MNYLSNAEGFLGKSPKVKSQGIERMQEEFNHVCKR